MIADDIAQNHSFLDILRGKFFTVGFFVMLCTYSLQMLKPTFFTKYMVILNSDKPNGMVKKKLFVSQTNLIKQADNF